MVNILLILGIIVSSFLGFQFFKDLMDFPEERTFINISIFLGLVISVVSNVIILWHGGTVIYIIR